MRIVLIVSPTSHEQIYGDWDLSGVDTYCPPLGLLYMAGFLREHRHTPYVVDVAALKWSLQETARHVLALNPDIVGLSAMTINVHNANHIAEELRKNGFTGLILLGGPHVTAMPVETLKKFGAIDYGVLGEGEITLLDVIETIEKNQSADHVRGLAWRNESGQIVINPSRPLIDDLDSLPLPAWDLLANFPDAYPHSALETRRLPAASIITSRGCPYQCTFCDRAIFGSAVRHHSAEYTLNMIRYLKDQYAIKNLMMLDDNFIMNKKKLFKVCETVIEEGMDLSWYCMGHANVMTEDRLRKIKEAGCWFIEIGIESGCDQILKLIKKNTTKAEVVQAVKRARAAGLKVKGNFIFGFPTETRETLEETIQFATEIDLSYFQQNFLTIWPGCELSVKPEQYGKVETDWNKLAHQRVTFIPHGLTEHELIQASKKAFRRFYLRPKIIFQILVSFLSSPRAARSAIISFAVFLKTIFRKG